MITKTMTVKSVRGVKQGMIALAVMLLLHGDSFGVCDTRKGKADYITNYSKENGVGHGHAPYGTEPISYGLG